MATGPQFVERMAPVCGIHPATLDRYMRELRAAGLIPAGGRGGGVASVHLDHNHAAVIILSLAASSPAGVVAAYNAVKDLDREHLVAGSPAGLGFSLALQINRHADVILHGHKPYGAAQANNWELTICLEPVTVWMSWTVDGVEKREYFSDRLTAIPTPRPAHPQDVWRGIRRQTIITLEVVNVAASLCADTIRHIRPVAAFNLSGPDRNPSPPDGALPDAPPENETAATLPGVTAAVSDQPATTGPDVVVQTHVMRKRKNPQSLTESQAGLSSNLERPTHERRRTRKPDQSAA